MNQLSSGYNLEKTFFSSWIWKWRLFYIIIDRWHDNFVDYHFQTYNLIISLYWNQINRSLLLGHFHRNITILVVLNAEGNFWYSYCTQGYIWRSWRSEIEYATSRSRGLPTILIIYEWLGESMMVIDCTYIGPNLSQSNSWVSRPCDSQPLQRGDQL